MHVQLDVEVGDHTLDRRPIIKLNGEIYAVIIEDAPSKAFARAIILCETLNAVLKSDPAVFSPGTTSHNGIDSRIVERFRESIK